MTDVDGLDMNPPDRALVLCVDEKSQIQSLDRSQPILPLKRGRAVTTTHDYKRYGTMTLFAALDLKSGKVIGECLPRHRAAETIRILKRIDRVVKKSLDVHLVLDNYGTHKTPKVKAWRGPTPGSACTSRRPPPRGSTWSSGSSPRSRPNVSVLAFTIVADLERAIHDYLARHYADPEPFV